MKNNQKARPVGSKPRLNPDVPQEVLKQITEKLMREGWRPGEEEDISREIERREEAAVSAEPPMTTEDQLNETLDEIDVDDLANIEEVIQRDMSDILSTLQYSASRLDYQPTPTTVRLRAALSKVFKKMRQELRARIIRERPSGRLHMPSLFKDVRKVIPTAKVFSKRIAPQQKRVDMGIVILVDESGSMDRNYEIDNTTQPAITIAKDTAWAISEAVEDDNGFAAVIGFGEEEYLRKDFRKQGDFTTWQRANTYVFDAIIEGQKKLMQLHKQHNLDNLTLVIITDGGFMDVDEKFPPEQSKIKMRDGTEVDWQYSTKVKAAISRIRNDAKITTILIFINDRYMIGNYYNTHYFIELESFTTLPWKLGKVVQDIQKRAGRRALKAAGG